MRLAAVRIAAVVAVVALSASGCAHDHATVPRPFPAGAGRGPCAVTKDSDVGARMRDGTVLRADVYRPATTDPVPVILMRTQYGKSGAQVSPARYRPPDWFASHCYLVVIQDVRGQGT